MINSEGSKLPFYDLAIIGGGINGAAIARDAALRGLKVILLEKTDFGSGASTKTSKLAHGGLRYLEQYEFGLVKESLQERNLLLKNAPHLVHPLKFIFPVYSQDARPLWQVNLGLYLYDFLTRNSGMPRHSKLIKEQILQEITDIESKGLIGGCAYYDAQMKDNRIVIENVLAAEHAGATVVNYANVTNFLWDQSRINGVTIRCSGAQNDICIKSTLVVNATGAWSNGVVDLEPDALHCRVVPTKGVHLVIPKVSDIGLILHAPQDGRIFFVLPWEGNSLIGSTDTFFSDDPDNVVVNEADIDYLLKAFCHYFPHLGINQDSIISTFVGLRPLVANHHLKKPSLVSRDHAIQMSEGGLITVLGGKFTTHRRMAEEAVDFVISHMDSSKEFKRCRTKEMPLPGAMLSVNNLEQELGNVGLNHPQIDYLLQNYGQLATHILEIIRKNPLEAEAICDEYPHIWGELTYSIQFEHVKKIEDWLYRRTSIVYKGGSNSFFEKLTQKFDVLYGKCRKNVVSHPM